MQSKYVPRAASGRRIAPIGQPAAGFLSQEQMSSSLVDGYRTALHPFSQRQLDRVNGCRVWLSIGDIPAKMARCRAVVSWAVC